MLEKNKICKTNGRVMVPVSRTVNLEYIWGKILNCAAKNNLRLKRRIIPVPEHEQGPE